MPTTGIGFVLLGCAGGLIPDLIRLIKGRYNDFPTPYKKPKFWAALVGMVILGGFVAWIGGVATAIQPVAYGYGAPEVVTRLTARETPKEGLTLKDASDERFNLREWWVE